jgi:hypothetical protein
MTDPTIGVLPKSETAFAQVVSKLDADVNYTLTAATRHAGTCPSCGKKALRKHCDESHPATG